MEFVIGVGVGIVVTAIVGVVVFVFWASGIAKRW